jgi:hypothetical protein
VAHPSRARRNGRFTSPGVTKAATAAASRAQGKAARERVPRSSHAVWEPPANRPDPLELLKRDDEGRLPGLLPIRYARMVATPFSFYRGAASIMASDLQSTPHSGIATQICGDAHLSNFGAFATPERRFVFDLNDFDETTAGGAWEWDIKRLATSFAIAGRFLGLRPRQRAAAVRACVASYRERIQQYAGMHVLDVWYARVDEAAFADAVGGAAPPTADGALHTPSQSHEELYAKLVVESGGEPRIADKPPYVFHPGDDPGFVSRVAKGLDHYRRSLPAERRALYERFRFVDAAYKVVGVGSVGTRCAVALLLAEAGDPLFLQIKEARASVYEAYVGPCGFDDQGERVVVGQHLMQAATDIFMGWARADDGHTFYVRQLRDMKAGADVERMNEDKLESYAGVCGWALARAHAKAAGIAPAVAGYLGRNDVFDDALVKFAEAYADQNEGDYAKLVAAVNDGRIVAAPAPALPAAPDPAPAAAAVPDPAPAPSPKTDG